MDLLRIPSILKSTTKYSSLAPSGLHVERPIDIFPRFPTHKKSKLVQQLRNNRQQNENERERGRLEEKQKRYGVINQIFFSVGSLFWNVRLRGECFGFPPFLEKRSGRPSSGRRRGRFSNEASTTQFRPTGNPCVERTREVSFFIDLFHADRASLQRHFADDLNSWRLFFESHSC